MKKLALAGDLSDARSQQKRFANRWNLESALQIWRVM
jgi:hypothetical protein